MIASTCPSGPLSRVRAEPWTLGLPAAYGPQDGQLLVYPEKRSAEFRGEALAGDEAAPSDLWAFWRLVLDVTLPLLRSVRISCGQCRRASMLTLLSASFLCSSCAKGGLVHCTCCDRRLPRDRTDRGLCGVCMPRELRPMPRGDWNTAATA